MFLIGKKNIRFTSSELFRGACIFSFLMLMNSAVFGQIVNMERQRYHKDTTGWSGTANGDISLTNYGQKIFSVNATAHIQYQDKRNLYLLLGSYGFLKGDQQAFIDYGFLHFRYNYKVNKVLRWEAFTQLQQNAITKIGSRFLLGAGPRFKISGTKKLHLYAASLLMFETERQTGVAKYINDCRNSSYVSLTLLPNDQTQLITTTYYQPVFFDFNDYRWLNQTTFKVNASKKIALTLNWSYQYDSEPALGVRKDTYNLSTGVEVNL